jgi:hypothetical protein
MTSSAGWTMHKLCFYVPESHLEPVKQAVFDAGAGRGACYDHCCWQVPGQGQFRPLPGSEPHLGETGQLQVVTEYKVEMAVEDEFLDAAIAALLRAHPYEEPAYDAWRIRR